jgi:hypothetical protein
VLPEIAALTCRHTSAQLTAKPGRRLHLDKSASAPLRVGEKHEVGPWAARHHHPTLRALSLTQGGHDQDAHRIDPTLRE